MGVGALFALFSRAQKAGEPLKPRSSRAPLFAASLIFSFLISALFLGSGLLLNFGILCVGILIVSAALCVGLILLSAPPLSISADRFVSPVEMTVVAGGLGMGVLALLIFVLGSIGFLHPVLWGFLLAGALLAGGRRLAGLCGALFSSARTLNARHPVTRGALAVLLVWVLAHVTLIWSPPLNYDVLEYHLAGPAQHLRVGQITFLSENVYANFPQNAEMFYLLAMLLLGKWNGLPAAHFVLFTAWVLSIAAVYVMTLRVTRGLRVQAETESRDDDVAPALAALLYAFIPLGSHLLGDFYVEHVQALFHLAAILAACAFLNERAAGIRARMPWLLVSGLLAGFCCGTKYTGLIFTLAPLALCVPLICAISGSAFEGVRAGLVLGASALAAFAPWLLRNLIMSGDPLFPLGLVMQRRAGLPTEIPDRIDHFEVAHRAGEKSLNALGRSLAQLWPSLHPSNEQANLKNWLTDVECGPHLLLFALAGFIRAVRVETILVPAVFLFDLAAWFLFSHRLNRFMYPLLGTLAVTGAIGIDYLWRVQPLRKVVVTAMGFALLALGPLMMLSVWLQSRPDQMLGLESPQDSAAAQYSFVDPTGTGAIFEAYRKINELPAGSKVLFIGDAQTFYADQTPLYSVVFNTPLLEEILLKAGSAAEATEFLAANGITHLYINYPEWYRLDRSYSICKSAPGRPWKFAEPSDTQRQLLRQLLDQKELKAYGSAWPRGFFPAYLKLDARGYETLEELIREWTTVEKSWQDAGGRRIADIRRVRHLTFAP